MNGGRDAGKDVTDCIKKKEKSFSYCCSTLAAKRYSQSQNGGVFKTNDFDG